MADNYLERKMEEHLSGGTTVRRSESIRSGVLQPGLHLAFPKMWLIVFADTADDAEPYVAELRSAGINVALSFVSGGTKAAKLSQKYGARLYPDKCEVDRMAADLAHNRVRAEYILDLRAEDILCGTAVRLSEQAKNLPPETVARAFLFYIHPLNTSLQAHQNLFDF